MDRTTKGLLLAIALGVWALVWQGLEAATHRRWDARSAAVAANVEMITERLVRADEHLSEMETHLDGIQNEITNLSVGLCQNGRLCP